MKTKLSAMLMAVMMVFAMAPLSVGVAFADEESADPAEVQVTEPAAEEADAAEEEAYAAEDEADAVLEEADVSGSKALEARGLPEGVRFIIGKKEITTKSAKGKGWTFKYKSGVGYLTLNKANITKVSEVRVGNIVFKSAIFAEGMNLKITLKGKNRVVSNEEESVTIDAEENLTITGKGSLYAEGLDDGIYVEKKLYIKNTTVSAKGILYNGINADVSANITGSKVTARGHGGLDCHTLKIQKSTVTAKTTAEAGVSARVLTVINSKVTATSRDDYGIDVWGYDSEPASMTVTDSVVTAKGSTIGLKVYGTLSLVKTSKGKYSTKIDGTATDEINHFGIDVREINWDNFRITEPAGGTFRERSGWYSVIDKDGNSAGHVVIVPKKANPLSVKGKTATVKYSLLKKADQNLAVTKVIKFVKAGKGTKTYLKTKGNSKILVDEATGAVTVQTGLKKGTYKVSIKVKAAGTNTYKAKSKTVKSTITVK